MARRDAPAEPVPFVEWADFLARFRWAQGEHVALVGPTGQGKTTLALQLLPRREWVTIVATKPRDATLNGLRREGYVRIPSWPPPNADTRRILLWPPYRSPADAKRQALAINGAMHAIFASGGWCVFADDVQYLTEHLGLRRTLDAFWIQSRSVNISLVAATQRPRHVPLAMWTQSTHLFIWQTAHRDDLRALGGLAGVDLDRVRACVARLPRFHALYLNTRDGRMAVTKAERPRP